MAIYGLMIGTLQLARAVNSRKLSDEILASGADRVVSTEVTERFAARLKTGEAILIRGARHELLMERDFFRDQALAALDAFLPGGEQRASAGPIPLAEALTS